MPFWSGYWQTWGGFGWIFPLVGMVMMIVMALLCVRMMGGLVGFGCMEGHRGHGSDQVDDLRREIQALKEEVRKLRDRS